MIHCMPAAQTGSPTQSPHAVKQMEKAAVLCQVLSSGFQIGPMITAMRKIPT